MGFLRGAAAANSRRRTVVAGGPIIAQPAQPALTVYGSATGLSAYAQPGALVIAGRDQYNAQGFKDISAAGGHVLIYLDVMINNAYGRYHDLLINSSVYGSAVPLWPGSPVANSYGSLNDFRVGGILQGKLEGVLELIVSENPHMAGFFMDDLGTRSYYPGFDWTTWGTTNQQAYRDGAIALMQTVRTVCDRHHLINMVNGTWGGGTLAANGGGYPTMSSHGCSLAEGGYVEHHANSELAGYWQAYAASSQWAAASTVTNGVSFMYAQMNVAQGTSTYANSGVYAYVSAQDDYSVYPAPWTSFHPTGLPSSVGGSSFMAPPAGATLINDLTRRSYWTTEDPAATVSEISGSGPEGDVIIRSTLVDGQRASFDPVANERSDLSGPDVPLDSVRWMLWHERIVQVPTNLSDGGWMLMGPNEIHGQTLTQATFMPLVGTSWDTPPAGLLGRKILDANAGRDTHVFYDVGPLDTGNWHQYKFGVFYTQGSNGWFELWRDGVRVIRFDGITTTEALAGYWKFANYRNVELTGNSVYDVSGVRVYDGGTANPPAAGWVSTSAATNYVGGGSATSAVIDKPSGTVLNDILIAHLHLEQNPLSTVTLPSGWTQVMSTSAAAGPLGSVIAWKRATSSEPSTYTFSWSTGTFAAATMHRFTGCVTTGDPFGGGSNFALSTSNTTPSVSYTAPGTGIGIWLYTDYADGATISPPSSYTKRSTQVPGSLTVATRADTAGSKTTGTGTDSGSGGASITFAGTLLT